MQFFQGFGFALFLRCDIFWRTVGERIARVDFHEIMDEREFDDLVFVEIGEPLCQVPCCHRQVVAMLSVIFHLQLITPASMQDAFDITEVEKETLKLKKPLQSWFHAASIPCDI